MTVEFGSWRIAEPGKDRVKAILDHIEEFGEFHINCVYWPKSSTDRDIKRLLKKGLVKQIRYTNWPGSFSKNSSLVFPETTLDELLCKKHERYNNGY